MPLSVQRLAFSCDTIASFLRAADEIDTGLAGMLGELLLANCFNVVSPMPLVAPTKTATRPGGRVEAMQEFEY